MGNKRLARRRGFRDSTIELNKTFSPGCNKWDLVGVR